MQTLLRIAGGIDRLSWAAALVATALVGLSCGISAVNAVLRYAFDISSNAWLEIQWQMFAGIFLLGAPQVLKLNEHVRVDILYGGYAPRTKLRVDIGGLILFLGPATVLMVYLSWPWFLHSWTRNEISANAGGLLLWPVKLLLPVGFALLFLQGMAELVRRIAALQGQGALAPDYERPLQ